MRFKLITTVIVACSVIVAGSAFAKTNDEADKLAMNGLKNSHLVFAEQGIVKGKTERSVYELWVDSEGNYRFNTVNGPYTGDYEIWDGSSLYQYTKLTDELIVRKISDDEAKPIPHPLLSKVRLEHVIKDIDQEELKLENRKTVAKHDAQTFTKTKTSNNKKVTNQITLNDERTMVLQSSFILDGQIVHEIKVDSLETNINVDSNLLKLPSDMPAAQVVIE